jgi:hypothetical protein
MHHLLRHDRRMQGVNVFRMSPPRPRGGLTVHTVEAVIKCGEAPSRWVTFDVCEYGRAGRQDKYGPWTMSRDSEDVYVVESCVLSQHLPRQSYQLTNVPVDTVGHA